MGNHSEQKLQPIVQKFQQKIHDDILSPNSLIKLNLSFNPIGSKGARFLSKAEFPLLENLYLGNCQLSSTGAHYFIKSNFTTLRQCNLTANMFETDGWYYLLNISFKQATEVTMEQFIFGLQAVNLIAMDLPKNAQVGLYTFSNPQFVKEMARLLKIRFPNSTVL